MEKLNYKSLMIGDWVYRPDCYDKVKEIRQNGIIGLDNLRGLIGFSEIEPIPLTPEILEKNGFVGEGYQMLTLDDDHWLEYYHHEHRLTRYWEGIDEWQNHSKVRDIVFRCHCYYVHELQHALKLCGINREINL